MIALHQELLQAGNALLPCATHMPLVLPPGERPQASTCPPRTPRQFAQQVQHTWQVCPACMADDHLEHRWPGNKMEGEEALTLSSPPSCILPDSTFSSVDLPDPGGAKSRHMRPCRGAQDSMDSFYASCARVQPNPNSSQKCMTSESCTTGNCLMGVLACC